MELMMNDEESGKGSTDDDDDDEEEEARRTAEEALYQQIYYRTYNASLGITGNNKETSNYDEEMTPIGIDSQDENSDRSQRDLDEQQTESMSLMFKLGSNNSGSSGGETRGGLKWKKIQTMKGENGIVIDSRGIVQDNQLQEKLTSEGLKEVFSGKKGMKKQREKDIIAEKSLNVTRNGGIFKDSLSKFEKKCEKKSSNGYALAIRKTPPSLRQLTKGCSFPTGLLNGHRGDDEDGCEGNLSGFQGSDDDCFVISSDSDEDQFCKIIDENDISEDSDSLEIVKEDPVKKPVTLEVQKAPESSVTKLRQMTSSRRERRYFTDDSEIKCSNCYSFGHTSNACPESDIEFSASSIEAISDPLQTYSDLQRELLLGNNFQVQFCPLISTDDIRVNSSTTTQCNIATCKKRKPPLCILCGVKGHVSYSCPDRLCFNCDRPGHQSRDCAFPPQRPHHRCSRCNMFGHSKEMCPDQWRQYHMTIKVGELVKVKRPDLTAMEKMYCYNCGRKGHLGHMCEDPRMPLPKGEKVFLCSMPIVCQYKELRYQTHPSTEPSGVDEGDEESDGVKREDLSALSSSSVEEINEIQKKRKRKFKKLTKRFALPSFYKNKKNPNLLQKLENGSQDVSVFCGRKDPSVDISYEYNQSATNSASGKCHLSSSPVSNHGNHRRFGKGKRGERLDLNSGKQDPSKKKASGNFQLLMAGIKKSGKFTKRRKTKKDIRDDEGDGLIMNNHTLNSNETMPYFWSKGNPHHTKQKERTFDPQNSKGKKRTKELEKPTGFQKRKRKKELVVSMNPSGQRHVFLE